MILIEFELWEYEYVFYVGVRWFIENWGKCDVFYYDKKCMEDDCIV